MKLLELLFGGTTPDCDLGPDELTHIISNRRRRAVMRALTDDGADTPVEANDLADMVAERLHGEDYTTRERKGIYVSIYQSHLGKMEDADIVEKVGRNQYAPGRNLDAALEAVGVIEDITE
jgi:hypothetical protein